MNKKRDFKIIEENIDSLFQTKNKKKLSCIIDTLVNKLLNPYV